MLTAKNGICALTWLWVLTGLWCDPTAGLNTVVIETKNVNTLRLLLRPELFPDPRYSAEITIQGEQETARLTGIASEAEGYLVDQKLETKEPLRAEGVKDTGPYLGQKPPGTQPQLFAPGIVSAAGYYDFGITFFPDGTEIYFTRRKIDGGENAILVSRLEKNGWSAPAEASFSRGFPSNEPFITPDGKRLFFGSERKIRSSDASAEYGIWYVERTRAGGWSEPHYQGPGMYVSASRSGNLFMTDISHVAGGGIICYPWAHGKYGKPFRLGDGVNSPGQTSHAFIAPDETYVIFDATRPGGQGGEGDFYASFKMSDGSWGEAFNLGDRINNAGTQLCPSVSPDGKYLFYTSNRDIYWVSMSVVEQFRPR